MQTTYRFLVWLCLICGSSLATLSWLAAPASVAPPDESSVKSVRPADTKVAPKPKEPVPLNPQKTVLLDVNGKRLLVKGNICLREGSLEMFACIKQTKEHESILAIDSEAQVIHVGLLALGAKPGTPVKFQPEYSPPTGTRIRIFCQWTDKDGKPHREPAESWVRNSSKRFFVELFDKKPAGFTPKEDSELKWDEKHSELYWFGHMTEKQRDEFLAMSKDEKYRAAIKKFFELTQPRPMSEPWVFAGSGFFVDQTTGKRSYLAEGGELICVANFPTAMLDIKGKSSADGENNLAWEAWTERIPPVGTDVLIELVPELDERRDEKKPATVPKQTPTDSKPRN